MNSLSETGASMCTSTQLPPAAKVAPFKQVNPELRRECNVLGVCQGFTPPCGLCDQHANADDHTGSTIETIAYWGAIVVLCAMSFATVAGLAGYLSVHFL